MNLSELRSLISQGQIEETIELFQLFVEEHYARFTSDVLHLSYRFHQIKREKLTETIPDSDYKREMNSITKALIELIESLDTVNIGGYKKKKSSEEIANEIKDLCKQYDDSRKKEKNIKSTPTRLREKFALVNKLGDIFINHQDLTKKSLAIESDGVIAGIACRYKTIPDTEAIDVFEKVVHNINGNFPKSCIVNALAEVIYSGQIKFGDDQRIYDLLDTLAIGAKGPLEKNIIRVRAELDYFLGKPIQ